MSEFEKDLYVRLGCRIKIMRKTRHMTQDDLAKELNVSQVLVSQYEKGTRKMPLETLEALSDIFECTMYDLMGTAFGKELIENSYESKVYEILQTTDLTEDDYKQILHYVEFYVSKKTN